MKGRVEPRGWMRALTGLILLSSCPFALALLRAADSTPEAVLPPPRQLPHVQTEVEEKPTGELSLDKAIELLLQRNYDLRVKAQEIPKGRADILSAALRNNPSVFFSADNIPLDRYSEQRPGAVDFEATFVQPVDANNKRRHRIRLAQQAQHVTEALYQDSVRQEIDKLYTAYTDVLAAMLEVRAAQADTALQSERVKAIRDLVGPGVQPRTELTQALVAQGMSETARRKAEAHLLQTRRDLAVLLAIPCEHADELNACGPIRDTSPQPPCVEGLIRLALHIRPDLTAYRFNVNRAQAQLERTRAERFEDVLLFYTPYQIEEFPGQAAQAAPGWEAGALTVLPVFDRKQGDIARAGVEVKQTSIEAQGVEQQVMNEVRQAATDHAVSRQSVERYERDILPGAQSILEGKQRLFDSGQVGSDELLTARKDYNDVVRLYWDVLVRHRRAMLRLNTAVGQRLLP